MNTPGTQFGTSISADGLTLLYDQQVGGVERIFISSRIDRDTAFPAATALDLATPDGAIDSDASISADGLDLYFFSSRDRSCVYRAHRDTPAALFSAVVELTALCDGRASSGPSISADGLTLVYNTTTDGYGEGEIYITTRASTAEEFSAGAPAPGVETPAGYAVLSADLRRLYYERETDTGFELRMAERAQPQDDFGTPAPITSLDITPYVVDIGLSADESVAVMAIQTTDNYDVYTATRPCL